MTTGLVLGKFYPPHRGHQLLVSFAQAYVDDLTILVETNRRETIPGLQRVEWMRDLFPHSRVLHLTDENPQSPNEHPDFWNIWLQSIRRHLPMGPDYVFASEEYGQPLAQVLGATFIPCNIARDIMSISGTAVRADPLRNWEYLPEIVRPYFLKRVCIVGGESSGKSTLAAALAAELKTKHVPEYARIYLERRGGLCTKDDMLPIARGQVALETALAREANRVLISDTDALLSQVWSEFLFNGVSPELQALADKQHFDLYLLLSPDLPWVADTVRYLPHQRQEFFERCRTLLEDTKRPYVIISGSGDARLQNALNAVRSLL
jgi:HTH-type transcriptional repressor of NAD biosynthesis genes